MITRKKGIRNMKKGKKRYRVAHLTHAIHRPSDRKVEAKGFCTLVTGTGHIFGDDHGKLFVALLSSLGRATASDLQVWYKSLY
jgi:hypothetical protein